MSIVPYLRPDLDQSSERPPLYITGALANAKPGDAYEGRLQIHNQIGACVVLSVTGDDLPVGGTVSIDGNEIVVAWPAYAEAAAPITNPGFEDGMAGWQGGAGWSTTTDNPIAGTRSAVFKDAPGSSILSSLSRYPVDAGDTIHASAEIRQGASSAGNAGAGVRMEFRDAAGSLVGHKDGNMVMSASNNAVKQSTVTVTPGDRPAGTELVNIACHGLRKRQNREVWADTFAWDHAVAAAGINADATICITIQIRDSAGRTAAWSGCISIKKSGDLWFGRAAGNAIYQYSDTLVGPVPPPGSNTNGPISCVNGRTFVSTAGNDMYTSTDAGSTWHMLTTASPLGQLINRPWEYSNGVYVSQIPSCGLIYFDGESFFSKLNVSYSGRAITIFGGTLYATRGQVRRSDDYGLTWALDGNPSWWGTQYCLLRTSKHLFTQDGSTYLLLSRRVSNNNWVTQATPVVDWPMESPNWAWNYSDQVMYVRPNGDTWVSEDAGVSWRKATSIGTPVDAQWRLTESGGRWAILLNNGSVLVSTDLGETWVAATSPVALSVPFITTVFPQ